MGEVVRGARHVFKKKIEKLNLTRLRKLKKKIQTNFLVQNEKMDTK